MDNSSRIRIMSVGDNLIHNQIYEAAKKEDGTYDFHGMYDPVKEILDAADIRIINQETILVKDCDKISSFPSFGSPASLADAVADAGFQVATHASNHALDKKMEGITDSIEIWKSKGVLTVGINENAESMEEIRTLERNGIKVAFLNYTATLNYHFRPAGKKYCVNVMKPGSKGMIREQILRAKSIADVVIVLPHWGCEYLSEPVSSQVEWGGFFASCGADIIIGTHPHVVQNMDFIITQNKRKVPCFYSLGNFISCQIKPFTALGAIADIEIIKDESGIRIEKSEMIPVITHTDEEYSMFRVYPLEAYNDELAGHNRLFKMIEKYYDISVNTEYYKKLFRDTLDKKAKEYNLFKTPADVRNSNVQGLFYTLRGKNKK